jgi:hypothetical protein
MSPLISPLPRVYLAGALAALGLGLYLLGRQAVSPQAAAATGCLTADFDSDGASPMPRWAELHLQACPHFDETTLYLSLAAPIRSGHQSGLIFSGTGPGDPRTWPRHIRVTWTSPQLLRVAYSREVRFLSRADSVGPVRIMYSEFDSPSP